MIVYGNLNAVLLRLVSPLVKWLSLFEVPPGTSIACEAMNSRGYGLRLRRPVLAQALQLRAVGSSLELIGLRSSLTIGRFLDPISLHPRGSLILFGYRVHTELLLANRRRINLLLQLTCVFLWLPASRSWGGLMLTIPALWFTFRKRIRFGTCTIGFERLLIPKDYWKAESNSRAET